MAINPDDSRATSLTLLQKLEDDSPGSWERFVRLYGPLVYGWVRNAGFQPADAADIRQDVFRTVSQKIHKYDRNHPSSSGFRGWLWGVTRLQLLQHLRQDKRQVTGQGGSSAQMRLQELVAQPEEPESVDGTTAQQVILQSALEILQSETANETWQAFNRMSMQGHSAKEIGRDLGMTTKAVRQAKFRVTRKLRELLGDNVDFTLNDIPEAT